MTPRLISQPWPIMRLRPLRKKVRRLLRDGRMLKAQEIAAALHEDVYDIGTVMGNMMRRGEVIPVSGYRRKWKLHDDMLAELTR